MTTENVITVLKYFEDEEVFCESVMTLEEFENAMKIEEMEVK